MALGKVVVRFTILPSGQVKNIKVISNTANQMLARICVITVRHAKFPPIPKLILTVVKREDLEVDYSFTIFPPDGQAWHYPPTYFRDIPPM